MIIRGFGSKLVSQSCYFEHGTTRGGRTRIRGRIFLFAFVMMLALPAPLISRAEEISDPLETVNRGIFWFNDTLDVYLFEPVAKGYDFVVPTPVQKGVSNFFSNLKFPAYLVSDLVQFKFEQAGNHTVRFLINSTAGVVGFFDIAEEYGFEPHYEDFGTALGYHGVPAGPYLVLPFLGPSNLRDGTGRIVDAFLSPTVYLSAYGVSDDPALFIPIGLYALDSINTRAELIEAIESGKEASLDFYLFARSAYSQRRESLINDGKSNKDPFEDEFDDEFEDEFDDEFEDDESLSANLEDNQKN
jgi:phospholipid-binding lipoprotein MlaA